MSVYRGNPFLSTSHRRKFAVWHKDTADATAATATAEQVFFEAGDSITITAVNIQPAAALTADATNNASIVVARRDANAANKVTVATLTTTAGGTGTWVAFDDITGTTLTNTALTDGQKLTVEITKGGTGVAVPIMDLVVEYTVNV